jgi:hypothetical protein
MFSGLKHRFGHQFDLAVGLDDAKKEFGFHFFDHYVPDALLASARRHSTSSASLPLRAPPTGLAASSSSSSRSSLRRWTAIRCDGGQAERPSFRTCRSSQRTSCPFLVSVHGLCTREIRADLNLTGSAVSVERVFSGGRDTISLRRASLKPETVRALTISRNAIIVDRERAQRESNA